MSTYLPAYLLTCLHVYLPAYILAYLPPYLPTYLPPHLPINLTIFRPLYIIEYIHTLAIRHSCLPIGQRSSLPTCMST